MWDNLLYAYCLDWSSSKTDYPLISPISKSCYHEVNDHWSSHVGSICYLIYNNWFIMSRNNQGIIIQTEIMWRSLWPCSFVNQNSHQFSWKQKREIENTILRSIWIKKLKNHIKPMFKIFDQIFWNEDMKSMIWLVSIFMRHTSSGLLPSPRPMAYYQGGRRPWYFCYITIPTILLI